MRIWFRETEQALGRRAPLNMDFDTMRAKFSRILLCKSDAGRKLGAVALSAGRIWGQSSDELS